MPRANFKFTISLEDYITLLSLPNEEQARADSIACTLKLNPHEASHFIAEVELQRKCSTKNIHIHRCIPEVTQDGLGNLYLMYMLRIITGSAHHSLTAVAGGYPPGTNRTNIYYGYGSYNLTKIPRVNLEKANWTGQNGVGPAVLNEISRIYKALGVINKSLEACNINKEQAKIKAIDVLNEAGFDKKFVNIAFGKTEGELTNPQRRAMHHILANSLGKIAAGQLIPLPR